MGCASSSDSKSTSCVRAKWMETSSLTCEGQGVEGARVGLRVEANTPAPRQRPNNAMATQFSRADLRIGEAELEAVPRRVLDQVLEGALRQLGQPCAMPGHGDLRRERRPAAVARPSLGCSKAARSARPRPGLTRGLTAAPHLSCWAGRAAQQRVPSATRGPEPGV